MGREGPTCPCAAPDAQAQLLCGGVWGRQAVHVCERQGGRLAIEHIQRLIKVEPQERLPGGDRHQVVPPHLQVGSGRQRQAGCRG